MSLSRVTLLGASLVCSVLKTMMAGQRGLDCNLCCFQVADFSDQDA